ARFKRLLMESANLDVSDWHVPPGFLEELSLRKNLNLTSFEGGPPVDDETFPYLGRFPLTHLEIRDAHVSQECMKTVGRLKTLTYLVIVGVPIDTARLTVLQGLRKLTHLELINCGLTDDSLRLLSHLPVNELVLDRNKKITDNGIAFLVQNHTPLKVLSLGETGITDKAIEELYGLASIEELWVRANAFTDRCIPYFNRLKNLRKLDLSSTGISDGAFGNLKSKTLKNFMVRQSRLTMDGYMRLKQSSPDLTIVTGGGADELIPKKY
ncbi:MAG TPA: hypothetical protein V6C72_02250, partial [Chroococcales cyanobacterium]